MIGRVPSLILLNGRRVFEEERRIAVKLIKKHCEQKLLAQRRRLDADLKDHRIKHIKQRWESWCKNATEFDDSFCELVDGELQVYGNLTHSCQEIRKASCVTFNFTKLEDLSGAIAHMSKFANIAKLYLGNVKMTKLIDLLMLEHLKNLRTLEISALNHVCSFKLFRAIVIHTLPLLEELNGVKILDIERERAKLELSISL